MRRRNKIDLRLNDTELAQLNHDVEKSGWSREKYLRALIANRPIRERPPMDLVSVLKQLQQINNNMNQIAVKANSLNFVDTAAYWENVDQLEELKGKLLEVMYG